MQNIEVMIYISVITDIIPSVMTVISNLYKKLCNK